MWSSWGEAGSGFGVSHTRGLTALWTLRPAEPGGARGISISSQRTKKNGLTSISLFVIRLMQMGIALNATSASLRLWHVRRAPNQLDPSATNCRSGGSDRTSLQAWYQQDLGQYWWGTGMLSVDILELTLIIWKCWGFHWHFWESYQTLKRDSRRLCTDLPRHWIRPLVWGSSKVWRFSLVRTIIFQKSFQSLLSL